MAGYDGSIRILTKISTDMAEKSLGVLKQTIKGTSKEIDSIVKKMDSLKGQKFYTDDYKKLQSDLALAEKEMQKMIAQDSKLADVDSKIKKLSQSSAELAAKMNSVEFAKDISKEYKNISRTIEKTKYKLEAWSDRNKELEEQGKTNTNEYRKNADEIKRLSSNLSMAEAEMKRLVESGKAFTIDTENKGYKELSGKYEQVNTELEKQKAIHSEIAQKQAESVQKVAEIKDQMQQLEEAGKAFNMGEETQEYANLERQLQYEEEALRKAQELQAVAQRTGDPYARLSTALNDLSSSLSKVLHPIEAMKSSFASAAENMKARAAGVAATIINGIAHPFQTMKNIASKAISGTSKLLSGMASVAKKVGSAIKSIVSLLKKAASSMSLFGKSTKSSNNMLNSGFKNLLKYGLGIRSMYVLINKFRTAVKEGFGNLAQYSEPVNSALSSLKSALAQLKNSLATAFAPILTAVAPALTALINLASKAATAVGMLVAALTGQKSFVKAIAVQENYASSLGKTAGEAKKAVKALAGFDKLNVLGKNDADDSGGGGGGGAGIGDMFETVDIPSKINDLAKLIKDAWEKADFTEIGALIGTKLKDALDSIPWDKIQATAAKVGKSLATLINGFVEVEGLGYSIGNTIAQAINTGLIGIEAFAKNLHWDSVGKFIGQGINGALENINWDTALSSAKHLGRGIATAINKFLDTTDFTLVGKTVARLINTAVQFALSSGRALNFKQIGNKVADGINGLFKNIKPKKLAEAINVWIKGALEAASTLLKKTDFKMIGDKIGKFLSTLDIKGYIKSLANLLWEAVKSAFNLLSRMFKSAPLETALISAFAMIKFTALGKSFAGNLSTALTGAISSVMPGILAAFGEFSIVSGVFEELTIGTDNLIAAIGKIAGAVAIAGAAMTAVFGFPVGLIATAIVGVTGAIAGTTTALSEMEQQMKEEEEISKYGQTLEELSDELDRNSEAIRDRIAESKEYVETAGVAESQMAQTLSDRYFELAEKQGRTNEETEEMRGLAEKLVQQLPELRQYYDEQTGLLNTTKDSVDKLIQSRLQEIQLQAIEEQLVQAYKDQSQALKDVVKAAEPVNEEQKHMNELQEKLQEIAKKRDLLDQYELLDQQIGSCTGNTEELIKERDNLWQKLTSGGTEEFPTFQSLNSALEDTQTELGKSKEKYDELSKDLADAHETRTAVEGNIAYLLKLMGEGYVSAAENGIEGYNGTLGNDTSMAETTEQAGEDIVDGLERGLDEHSPSKKFAKAAEYAILGFIQGITKNKQYALNIMKTLAKSIVQEFRDIKRNFESKGRDIISGIRSGISSIWSGFMDYWNGRKEAIVNKFSNIKSRMETVGKNIVNGIIDGIKAIWSTLAGWAQKIIDMFTIKVGASDGGGTNASSEAAASYSARMSAFSNVATPKIPQLASGAVIRGGNPFLAVLGDQPHGQTNIETPLPTMLKAMKQAIAESGGMGGDISVRVYIGEKDVTQMVKTEADSYFKRTGKGLFAY